MAGDHNLEKPSHNSEPDSPKRKSVSVLRQFYEEKARVVEKTKEGEKREKISNIEKELDSLVDQLSYLKDIQFSPGKLYSPSRDRLYLVLRDWHEKIQNNKLENLKTYDVLGNIEKLQYKIEEKTHDIGGAISEFNKKYYDDLMKFTSKDTRNKYYSMIDDILECFNRFQSDQRIIDSIRHFQSGLDVELKREVQEREERQNKE